ESHFCTATLIAPDIVLTAGHCADMFHPIEAFYTGQGKETTDRAADPSTLGMVRHEVAAQVTYPTYDSLNECPHPMPDVALVRLSAPIRNIRPAKIGGPPTQGASCRAVGFGVHNTGDGGTVRLAKRSAMSTVVLRRKVSFDVKVGSGIADSGDSGGPLFCDDV